jgi:uncharacterized protein (DUF169 family)
MTQIREGDHPKGRCDWSALNARLVAAVKTYAAPVAISFLRSGRAAAVARLDRSYPAPNEQGRTGQVPAGCVFWIHGSSQTFATTAEDHANCSVGSLTHGFLTPEKAASRDDVCAVLEAGWVSEEAIADLPRVRARPETVVYGPLASCQGEPDAVLLRINALGLMTFKDALPDMLIEGKPQCHIVPLASENQAVAASVGCALSRARTGMKAEELTCVIPGPRLAEVVEKLEAAVGLDRAMASYAAADARRFEG